MARALHADDQPSGSLVCVVSQKKTVLLSAVLLGAACLGSTLLRAKSSQDDQRTSNPWEESGGVPSPEERKRAGSPLHFHGDHHAAYGVHGDTKSKLEPIIPGYARSSGETPHH